MNVTHLNGKLPRPAMVLPLIAEDLARVEQIIAQALAPFRARFDSLIDHLRHYRGKRLRPALLLLVARACGRVTPAHHLLGAAIELIHTATLVHDDVLDEADLRRHVSTVNAAWGNKISILLGDLLFTSAFHLTGTLGDARACEWIGEATNRVCAGEIQQLTEAGNLSLPRDDYFAIIESKTAALTEVACRLGAVYAGANEETARRLGAYGKDLGLAFQIADDVLDLVGDEHKAGKTLGTDLKQRKLTLPLIYLFESLPEAECVRLQRAMREPGEDRLVEVKSALAAAGSVDQARAHAEGLASQARRALGCLEPSLYRDTLRQLTEWVVSREQ